MQLARVGEYERLAEPEAAAVYYASFTRVETGSVIAVYDLGGGTFDVTVLRKEPTRFELIGAPRGVDRLGGIDFDDAIVGRVLDVLEHDLATVDMDSDAVRADLVVLRQECVQAKELLSTNPEAVVPVRLGNLRQEIRITRPEFEGLVQLEGLSGGHSRSPRRHGEGGGRP